MGYGAGVKTVPVHPCEGMAQYQSVTSQNALRGSVLGVLPPGTFPWPRNGAWRLEFSAPTAARLCARAGRAVARGLMRIVSPDPVVSPESCGDRSRQGDREQGNEMRGARGHRTDSLMPQHLIYRRNRPVLVSLGIFTDKSNLQCLL